MRSMSDALLQPEPRPQEPQDAEACRFIRPGQPSTPAQPKQVSGIRLADIAGTVGGDRAVTGGGRRDDGRRYACASSGFSGSGCSLTLTCAIDLGGFEQSWTQDDDLGGADAAFPAPTSPARGADSGGAPGLAETTGPQEREVPVRGAHPAAANKTVHP